MNPIAVISRRIGGMWREDSVHQNRMKEAVARHSAHYSWIPVSSLNHQQRFLLSKEPFCPAYRRPFVPLNIHLNGDDPIHLVENAIDRASGHLRDKYPQIMFSAFLDRWV